MLNCCRYVGLKTMINMSMAVYSPDHIFRSTTGGPASGIGWLLEGVLENCVDFYFIENSEEPVTDFPEHTSISS